MTGYLQLSYLLYSVLTFLYLQYHQVELYTFSGMALDGIGNFLIQPILWNLLCQTQGNFLSKVQGNSSTRLHTRNCVQYWLWGWSTQTHQQEGKQNTYRLQWRTSEPNYDCCWGLNMTKLQAGHSLEVKAFLTMNQREDNHDNDVGNALFLMMSSEGCTHRPWKEGKAGNHRWFSNRNTW